MLFTIGGSLFAIIISVGDRLLNRVPTRRRINKVTIKLIINKNKRKHADQLNQHAFLFTI